MTSNWDPDAAGVLIDTFRRVWEAGGTRFRLGHHELTPRGVAFKLPDLVPVGGQGEPEVAFAWSEILGAVINDARLEDLKARVAGVPRTARPISSRARDARSARPLPAPTHRPAFRLQ